MELHLTAMDCHLSYGITQYYLSLDTSVFYYLFICLLFSLLGYNSKKLLLLLTENIDNRGENS